MSNEQGMATPTGPPWSLDVIADVHAGVYPPETEARLRAEMAADPEAQAVLAALSSVVDDLSLLPVPVMPEQYASRLDRAITAESMQRSGAGRTVAPMQSAPVTPPPPPVGTDDLARRRAQRQAPPPPPRFEQAGPSGPVGPVGPTGPDSTVRDIRSARSKRRVFLGIGIAAAVAAIATVTVVGLRGSESPGTAATDGNAVVPTTVSNSPAPTAIAPPNALQFDPANMQAAYEEIQGKQPAAGGSLADPITYVGCLTSLDITSQDQVLGVADGTYEGRSASAIAVVVPGDPGGARIIVVAQGCSAAGADVLEDQTVSR
ncbi:hypothetical protein GIS00_15245 [Nakamurella sp. YIM 132087]|uniref:Uncharacterized protein n=1 Tax=Nakamurella alba TaxID=2665158 RepID=A0A7K1FMA8_9ACTN|nr:hypothetical protein [Nakamurella alba]MTD15297.1 hypothetical protein [Nakamurella alba]